MDSETGRHPGRLEPAVMRAALVGHTGFVGSNLLRQTTFGDCYNSSNIQDICGREFDLLICAGVIATKWWANQNAAADRARIQSLLECLTSVRSKRTIVISTIDVYPVTSGVDERYDCRSRPNHAYGTNRLEFEEAVRALFPQVLVARLAGVFGPGLKKNVLYDLLHGNGLAAINPASCFQYYNISNLWCDLRRAEAINIDTVNLVYPPLCTSEIIDRFFPGTVVGGNGTLPEVHYDVTTIYSAHFGGRPLGYIGETSQLLAELESFIGQEKQHP
jgi:RmlD substrate binding domain